MAAALPSRTLRAILLGGAIVFAGTMAHAGPALVPEAAPAYNDPLSRIRPVEAPGIDISAGEPAAPQPVVDVDSNAFTIIGAPTTGGLSAPDATDDLREFVRNEFLGQSDSADADPRIADTGINAQNPQASASNLVRALVNTIPGEAGAVDGAVGSPQQNGGQSLIGTVIDATLVDLVSAMLNPKIAADGMVTFSIAGFGEFALLLLAENQGIFLVDLNQGSAFKIGGVSPEGSRRSLSGNTGEVNRSLEGAQVGSSNGLVRLIDLFNRNIVPVVVSPITLSMIVLFSILWIIWRLSGRE